MLQPARAAGGAAAEAEPADPPAWEDAHRISQRAVDIMSNGDVETAAQILQQGLTELAEQYPRDVSLSLLHSQLWCIQFETGQYAEALEQAKAAYDVMKEYFGEDSADAAFHGVRLGISLAAANGDMDQAMELLGTGAAVAEPSVQSCIEEMQKMGMDHPEMESAAEMTQKLIVALAECNIYGGVATVRAAIQKAEELSLPMSDLQNAWLGGFKQLAVVVPPEHPVFTMALREIGRLIPAAAGRPQLQDGLREAEARLSQLVEMIKQDLEGALTADDDEEGGEAEGRMRRMGGVQAEDDDEEEFLP